MDIVKRPKIAVHLNITPLIDIVFLLLIFFMLTSTFMKDRALTLNLPRASSEFVKENDMLKVTIIGEDQYQLGEHILTKSALEAKLASLQFKGKDESPVLLRIDNNSAVQLLVSTMEVLQNAGLTNISVATEEP
ncbi:MAG: biopolymer transporter ExbD [Bdellovibrionales bacterium]|nr:biopolymer transporter ExbD [Bdellovibrionales bacterium]